MDGGNEEAKNWRIIRTPLGEPRSGMARYAAAMFFYERRDMNAETLEAYRICAPLDSEDPLSILRDQDTSRQWIVRLAQNRGDRG